MFGSLGLALALLQMTLCEAGSSERRLYNEGTARLAKGDLEEATALLRSVVGGKDEPLQSLALYNLGHVRFQSGREELRRGPDAAGAAEQGGRAIENVDPVLRDGREALRTGQAAELLAAYLRGRGARKDVKAAVATIQRALETHGTTLTLWQRAAGDFRGVAELRRGDEDAAFNADVMDRQIARLADRVRQLSRVARELGNRQSELQRMLEELKGRLPESLSAGARGDDEEDLPDQGPQPGQREPTRKPSREVELSSEEARRLLHSFQLDRNRILPMGGDRQAKPSDAPSRSW